MGSCAGDPDVRKAERAESGGKSLKIYIKRVDWQDGIWLHLPATEEEAEAARRKLGEEEASLWKSYIEAVQSPFPELEERLSGGIVFADGNLERLNRLAEGLEALDEEARTIFGAALRMEAPYTTEQMMETLEHLGAYTLHPEIRDPEQMGRYFRREESAQLPEELDRFIDYERIGRLWEEEHGLLTDSGFVERQKVLVPHMKAGEGQKTQRRDPGQGIFSVTLIRNSFQDRYVRFILPLPEQELAEKKRQAGLVEEIPERVEVSASIDGLLEHLPPGSTLEELNRAAEVIEEMERCSGIDWRLALTALEAELPGTMEECCRVIRNHEAYEFLPFPFLEPESYGHDHLERAGVPIPKGLAACFDYRRYGQEKMAEDGAVETFYGIVVNRECPVRLDHGEKQELKLYAPLTLTTFSGLPMHPELYRERIPAFERTVKREITRSMQEYGKSGLAETLSNRILSGKIASMFPDVEEHQGRLWGVVKVCTIGELTDREMAGLKEEWKEIAAHGWGEQFSCHTLKEGNVGFHAGFWDTDRGEDLCLMTEEEFEKEVRGFELTM